MSRGSPAATPGLSPGVLKTPRPRIALARIVLTLLHKQSRHPKMASDYKVCGSATNNRGSK
jgi:hypothetical protein